MPAASLQYWWHKQVNQNHYEKWKTCILQADNFETLIYCPQKIHVCILLKNAWNRLQIYLLLGMTSKECLGLLEVYMIQIFYRKDDVEWINRGPYMYRFYSRIGLISVCQTGHSVNTTTVQECISVLSYWKQDKMESVQCSTIIDDTYRWIIQGKIVIQRSTDGFLLVR